MRSVCKSCSVALMIILIIAIGCSDGGDPESGSNSPQTDNLNTINETPNDKLNDEGLPGPGNKESMETSYEKIDFEEYPAMTDKEIGQLRWALKIADADLADFSLIPSLNILGVPVTGTMNITFSSLRYNVAFYTYYLATLQYHKIPACQDIIQSRMDRMIMKMQEGAVWKYWATTSMGYFTFWASPLKKGQTGFYKSERDPVRIRNIMYSGHLAQMIALYEKLYGDMKWDQPDAIKFIWSDDEQYTYSSTKLHKLLRDAIINQPANCIQCEPNLCFTECNQHPMLALKLFDQVHGTTYFDDVLQLHLDWYDKNDLIDPETHNACAMYFPLTGEKFGPEVDDWDAGNILSLVSIPVTKLLRFKLAFAIGDAWTMSFMNAWRRDYIQKHYWGVNGDGGNRANRIDLETGRVKADVIWDDRLDLIIIYDSLGIPFYGMLAAEMGDTQVRNAILEQCDSYFKPEWTDRGEFHYPIGKIDTLVNFPGEKTRHVAIPGTGALAGMARSNPTDGLYKLHNDPVPGAEGPKVEYIDIYKTNLRRAIYDSDLELLIVTTDIGPLAKSCDVETFKITNMDPRRNWVLYIDGNKLAEYASGESEITVSVPLDGPHNIVLAAGH